MVQGLGLSPSGVVVSSKLVGYNDNMEPVHLTHPLAYHLCGYNSFQAISAIRGARYGVFTNKKHALNTLKMDRLFRNDVMLS
jgi:hypothetical protein